MTKLKNPLLSFNAHNTISKAITFVRRRGQNIAEKKPELIDVKSTAQLSWRHMYQKCAALWHTLSAAEQAEWNSLGGIRHMTGFAYWQSQCLRPNPGIYLPLQGGSMSGDIEMNKNRILELPLPVDSQEALTLAYYTANIAPYLYHEGARAFHNAAQAIPNNVPTILALNSERWDTDAIHDNAVNNSRLTCQTAGKYVITANLVWEELAGGRRQISIYRNGLITISILEVALDANNRAKLCCSCIEDLAVGEFVELRVLHNQGAPLNILFVNEYSPEFMMSRVGA